MDRLYYIASNHPTRTHAEQVDAACTAGVKLIQLRMKGFSHTRMLHEALSCKEICEYFEATLIINDEVDLAQQIGAQGVHLGQSDTHIKTARSVLGPDAIIGGTANTQTQVTQLQEDGVDYIGLGPFRFTETKKNLSPVLGLSGYEKIMSKTGIKVPVYAIGGIRTEDIESLMKTGVYGIAVSQLLQNNFSLTTEIIRTLNQTATQIS